MNVLPNYMYNSYNSLHNRAGIYISWHYMLVELAFLFYLTLNAFVLTSPDISWSHPSTIS